VTVILPALLAGVSAEGIGDGNSAGDATFPFLFSRIQTK
jgi:hypothetical protein